MGDEEIAAEGDEESLEGDGVPSSTSTAENQYTAEGEVPPTEPPVEGVDEEASAKKEKRCAVSSAPTNRACWFPQDKLFGLDGMHWCAVHLPLVGDDGTPSEKVKWSPEEMQMFLGSLMTALFEKGIKRSQGSDIDFSYGQFPDLMIFHSQTIVESSISFERAVFGGAAFFRIHSEGDTSFHGARFRGRADFRGSGFGHGAYFWNAQFDDIAQFMGVPFSGDVGMHHAVFAKSVDFSDAKFGGNLNFDGVQFEGDAKFAATGTNEEVSINEFRARGAKFGAEALFTNRKFLGSTDFEGVTFSIAPEFHGCTLHPGIYFPRLEKFLDTSSPRAASRYRMLFQAMGDFRAHDEEAMFFALLQRAVRHGLPAHDPIKIVSWTYDTFSQYGQSIRRPLAWLVASQVLFFALYASMGCSHAARIRAEAEHAKSVETSQVADARRPRVETETPQHSIAGAAAAFCGQQLFRPFAIWGDGGADKWPRVVLFDPRSPWPFFLGTVQTLLSALWIYFLVLGTRWRFRRW